MQIPSIGEVFEDRYELRSLLGQGGFATVYLAWDLKTQRDVVLKVLSPDKDGTYPPTIAARFQREAQIFATLAEPHIVSMYDFGQSSYGLLFMAFEYVAGRDLAVVMRGERLPTDAVKWIIIQLLEALREAHRHGVLHRDLKPANVLLHDWAGDPYRVKLIDFGIAKDVSPEATRLTQTGNVVGTLRYMSPEQIYGEPLTPAADIFCLGMVAYEMLTGGPLIAGSDRKSMLQEHATLSAIELPALPGAPQLRGAILRALELAPEDRFGSADAMLAALRATASPQPPPQTTAPTQQSPPVPAKPRTKWLVGGIIAVLGAIAALIALNLNEEPAATVVVEKRDISSLTEEAETIEVPAEVPEERRNEKTVAAASPCDKPPPFVGLENLYDGAAFMRTYIPTNYDPEKPPGLVIGLHRQFRTGLNFLKHTEITESADRYNWIVIAPDAGPLGWGNDIAPALHAVDMALSQLCIDRTRLHVFGDEVGVSMGHRLACALPVSSVVAAFAPGSFGQCTPEEPFPYLRIHTLQDPIHPPSGRGCVKLVGNLGRWSSIENSMVGQLACTDATTAPWEPYPDACRQYTSCSSPVVSCGFDGGHQWPKSSELPVLFTGCNNPKTTAPLINAAAQFMAEHGRALTPEQIAAWDRARGIEAK